MFVHQQQLEHQIDFDNAQFTEVPITVWRENRYIDYGGKISKHDDVAVYIDGGYFLKSEFRFLVRLDG